MSWSPNFDGFALDETNGITIEEVRETPKLTAEMQDLLTTGSAIVRRWEGGREVELSGKIVGTSASDFQSKIDDLMGAFAAPAGGYLSLNSTREIFAYPEAGDVEVLQASGNQAAGWSCRFTSTAAYWRSTTEDEHIKTYSSSSPIASSFTLQVSGGAVSKSPVKLVVEQYGVTGERQLDLLIKTRSLTPVDWIRIRDATIDGAAQLVIDPDTESIYFEGVTSDVCRVPKRVDGSGLFAHAGVITNCWLDTLGGDGKLKFTFTSRQQYPTSGY